MWEIFPMIGMWVMYGVNGYKRAKDQADSNRAIYAAQANNRRFEEAVTDRYLEHCLRFHLWDQRTQEYIQKIFREHRWYVGASFNMKSQKAKANNETLLLALLMSEAGKLPKHATMYLETDLNAGSNSPFRMQAYKAEEVATYIQNNLQAAGVQNARIIKRLDGYGSYPVFKWDAAGRGPGWMEVLLPQSKVEPVDVKKKIHKLKHIESPPDITLGNWLKDLDLQDQLEATLREEDTLEKLHGLFRSHGWYGNVQISRRQKAPVWNGELLLQFLMCEYGKLPYIYNLTSHNRFILNRGIAKSYYPQGDEILMIGSYMFSRLREHGAESAGLALGINEYGVYCRMVACDDVLDGDQYERFVPEDLLTSEPFTEEQKEVALSFVLDLIAEAEEDGLRWRQMSFKTDHNIKE